LVERLRPLRGRPSRLGGTVYYKIISRKKMIATRIADLVGYAVWAPFGLFKKKMEGAYRET
jgi:hypothetical protein